MGTKHADIFAALAAEFEPHEVKKRQQGGRDLSYITARVAMNRLDNVLGPEAWWDDYVPGENSVLCRLTIILPDGRHLTKCDAGGYAGMADSGDDDKSGYSDGFKRACVKFGVGRYLYKDGVPTFAQERVGAADPGAPPAGKGEAYEGGERHRDNIPWGGPRDAAGQGRERSAGAPRNGNGDAPRSGKALFARLKEMEQQTNVGLLKWVNGWSKLQEFPDRIVDFDAEQVSLAWSEVVRKLASLQAAGVEPDEA